MPLRWANYEAVPALGGTETSPNDVMLLVKQFMSDADLMQPPELMLTAGASAMLQPLAGPGAWDYREDIDEDQIERLCRKESGRAMPFSSTCNPLLAKVDGSSKGVNHASARTCHPAVPLQGQEWR